MSKWTLTIIVLMVGLCSNADATTYYVSRGGDNSVGTSWATAFTHPDSIESYMAHGDSVYIGGGGGKYFNCRIQPPIGGGSADTTFYIDSAGGSGPGRAILSGGDSVQSWVAHDTVGAEWIWVAEWMGTDCWGGAATNDPNGTRSFTLTFRDTLRKCQLSLETIDEVGEWTHIETAGNDSIYFWVPGGLNPNDYETIASCKPPFEFNNTAQDYITLEGLGFEHGKQGTILFSWNGYCDHILIHRCRIRHVGHDYGENPSLIFKRASNLTDPPNPAHGIAEYINIVSCSLTSSMGTAASYYEHAGSGIELYCARRVKVDSCVIHDVSGNGVMWKNQSAMNDDSVIYYNVLSNSRLVDVEEFGYAGGNNNYSDSVYGNIFIRCREAAIEPFHGNDVDYGCHFICNNTVDSCSMFLWVRHSPPADSTSTIKYNIFYNWSSEAGGFDYYNQWARVEHNYFDCDSNAWYDPVSSFSGYCNSASATFAQWQSCGNDSNGVNNAIGINTTTYALPDTTSLTMNRTYGGQTWTVWGAVQTTSGGVHARGKITASGNVRIQ